MAIVQGLLMALPPVKAAVDWNPPLLKVIAPVPKPRSLLIVASPLLSVVRPV